VGITAGSGSSSRWMIALAAVATGLAGFAVRRRQADARS
jgi:LPXTG-motif cell wall-anchored protein